MSAQVIFDTFVLAATYILLAVGYILVYRTSRLVNLMHGDAMMILAFLAFSIGNAIHWFILTVLLVTILALIGGILFFRTILRGILIRSFLGALLLTISLSIILQGIVILVWTPRMRYPVEVFRIKNQLFYLGDHFVVAFTDLLLIATALCVIAFVTLFLRRSRMGLQMLACSENRLLLALRGVDPDVVTGLAWGLSISTAAIAGIFYSVAQKLDGTLSIIGLKALVASLVAGMTSLWGVVPGAIVVSAAEIGTIQFLSPSLGEVVPFIILLVILLIRPWGLVGRKEEYDRV